jgi:hypothetical protein
MVPKAGRADIKNPTQKQKIDKATAYSLSFFTRYSPHANRNGTVSDNTCIQIIAEQDLFARKEHLPKSPFNSLRLHIREALEVPTGPGRY